MYVFNFVGGTCRTRVTATLCKKFETPKAAEEYFQGIGKQFEAESTVNDREVTDDRQVDEDDDSSRDDGQGGDVLSCGSLDIAVIDTMGRDHHLQYVCRMESNQHLQFVICSTLLQG